MILSTKSEQLSSKATILNLGRQRVNKFKTGILNNFYQVSRLIRDLIKYVAAITIVDVDITVAAAKILLENIWNYENMTIC